MTTPPTAVARLAARVLLPAALAAEWLALRELFATPRFERLHWYLGSIAIAAVAVALLWAAGLSRRVGAAVVLGVAAVLQLLALSHRPSTSDDVFRYVWDGTVQLHGIDPYRYVPADPALRPLRFEPLFGTCGYHIPDGCTRINRPTVHTIYPPVAQAVFTSVRFLGGPSIVAFQLVAAAGVVAIAWLLLRQLRVRGRPLWLAAVWAWCPLVVTEFGNNAHIDWLAVGLVLLAFEAYRSRRDGWAGALVGAAIATKLYPGLVLTSLMRRHPWRVAGAALGVVIAGYVPHVLAVGREVIGYLPSYLGEEGYRNGTSLLLLRNIVPHPLDVAAGALILLAASVWAWWCAERLSPEVTATTVTGIALLVATPRYGWYAALLLGLIALSGLVEWLPVALASSMVYLVRMPEEKLHIQVACAAATLVLMIARHAYSGRTRRRADRPGRRGAADPPTGEPARSTTAATT